MAHNLGHTPERMFCFRYSYVRTHRQFQILHVDDAFGKRFVQTNSHVSTAPLETPTPPVPFARLLMLFTVERVGEPIFNIHTMRTHLITFSIIHSGWNSHTHTHTLSELVRQQFRPYRPPYPDPLPNAPEHNGLFVRG